MAMEACEGEQNEGALESARAEIAKQRLQMETFFADLALRLLVDRPKTEKAELEKRQFWNTMLDGIEQVMKTAPPKLHARLKQSAQSKFDPCLISFDDTDAGLAEQLADARQRLAKFGKVAIGPLFIHKNRVPREKLEQLIEKETAYWELTLGKILAAVSELSLVKSWMKRLENHSRDSELGQLAEKLKAEVRTYQEDELGRDARGRKNIDWTTTVNENGIVFNALLSIVSNRAGTALKAQLFAAAFVDVNVDGRLHLDEFDVMDWAELRKDLGLNDIAPYRELIESAEAGPLRELLAQERSDREQVVQLVHSVLGHRADLDPDICIQVVGVLHERLSRFTRQWIRLQRHEAMPIEQPPESRGHRRVARGIDESESDEADVDLPDLLGSEGQEESSPNGSLTSRGESAEWPEDEDDSQGPGLSNEADPDEVLTALDGESLDELDGDFTEHFDEAGFLSAFLSATCATQLFVWMKKGRLAKVPIGRGDDWSEKDIVFAATVDAMYRLAEPGRDPAIAGRELCERLFSLSHNDTNKGFCVFATEAEEERGQHLYKMVVDLAEIWRANGREATGDLQTFELNHEGRFALTKRDRDDLMRMFERSRKECSESAEGRLHLLHYLEIGVERIPQAQHSTPIKKRAAAKQRPIQDKEGRHHG